MHNITINFPTNSYKSRHVSIVRAIIIIIIRCRALKAYYIESILCFVTKRRKK